AYSCGASSPPFSGAGFHSLPASGVLESGLPDLGSGSVASSPEPLELTDFTPLLALPELTTVGEAVDAGEAELADAHYVAALSGPLREAASEPQYQFQLGRLASDAREYARAAEAFTGCATQQWELSEYCAYFAARAHVRQGASQAALERLSQADTSVAPLRDWWVALRGEAALAVGDFDVAATAL